MGTPQLPVPEATRVITITIDATTADILGRLTGPQEGLHDAASEMITRRCAYLERTRIRGQLPASSTKLVDEAAAGGFYNDGITQKE